MLTKDFVPSSRVASTCKRELLGIDDVNSFSNAGFPDFPAFTQWRLP